MKKNIDKGLAVASVVLAFITFCLSILWLYTAITFPNRTLQIASYISAGTLFIFSVLSLSASYILTKCNPDTYDYYTLSRI